MELELPRLLAPDLPSIGFQQCLLDTIHCTPQWLPIGNAIFRRCLASYCVSIGQFARLLLPVEMDAIFKAPSPESNPNPPLPVKGKVVHYTTFNLIGGEFVQQRTSASRCASASLACVNNCTCRLNGDGLCFGQQLPRLRGDQFPSPTV